MSLEAMIWALKDAPGVPAHCVGVLMGLAEAADPHGRGAFSGQAKLARYARKTDRQVRSDMTRLAELGIIREGDQSLAAYIPGDARPTVWDLAMDRKSASAGSGPSDRKSASAGSDRKSASAGSDSQPPDQRKQKGTGSQLPVGDEISTGSTASRERKPASYNPTTNPKPKNSPTESSPGGSGGSALFDAGPGAPARPAGRRKPASASDADFERWYAAYPVHKARGDAEKAWAQVTKAGADPEVLIAAAERYAADPQVARGYGKFPAGWLRAKCWLDEPAPDAQAASNGTRQVNFSDEEYTSGWH